MNIVKLRKPIMVEDSNFELTVPINSITTDLPIWVNDKNEFVITVLGTTKLRFIPIGNIKYICPVDKFTGE